MKNIINKIVFKFYRSIFKEEPSSNVKTFIENIWYVGIGFAFYALFGFIFQILSGRILGPSEYGKYALIQSIALFLYLPMNLGISTALIKYNAESEDENRRAKIISSSYFLTFGFSLVSLLILYVFSKPLSRIFFVSENFFYLAVFYALFNNFYILTTSIFRSLHKNKEFSFFQAFYGFLSLFLILPFFLNNYFSFKAAVFSSYAAYLLISLLIFIRLHGYLIFRLDKYWIKKLLTFGAYATMAGVASAFSLNLDKVILNKYFSSSEVGIYWVYYNSFILFISVFFNIFNTVFFPIASMHPRKDIILKKINRFVPYLFTLGLIFIFFSGLIIFKLYGKSYPFNIFLGLLFSIISILFCLDSIYAWLMAATGKTGAKIVSINGTISATISIILNILLIPILGIMGAAISRITSCLVSISIILYKSRNFKLIEEKSNI